MKVFQETNGQHVDSYYAESANDTTSYPQLSTDVEADVCIVGAGFSGLSTAIELAENGFKVVVVEAVRVGWAASGRNGGQILGGWKTGYDEMEKSWGLDAANMFANLSEEGKQIIYERASKYSINADIKKGFFLAAMNPSHMRDLDHYATDMNKWSYPHEIQMVNQQDMKQHIDSDAYVGGMYDMGKGHFHPLNFVLGEARAASSLGVEIFENSPVVKISGGDEPTVFTQYGKVKAKQVVLAGNCYLGNVAPALEKKIMPASTFVIATEPLGEARAKKLLPRNMAVCDMRHILDYYRLSADNRLLFGGKTIYSGASPKSIKKAMQKDMLKVFPQLADVKIDYAWGGHIDLAVNRMPHLGEYTENVFYMQGFSGYGVVPTHIAGRVMAEKIMGKSERYDVWSKVKHHSFPGGTLLRKPGFLLGSNFFRLRDMWAAIGS